MHYDRIIIFSVLLLLSVSIILSAGCTSSKSNSCNENLDEIYNLETSALNRINTMDFLNPDEFFDAQAEASKKQFSEVMALMAAGDVRECLGDVQYSNMIRFFDLVHSYFDISIKYVQINKGISEQTGMSYAEYQKNLRDSINQLEDLSSDAEYLLIMAGNIDASKLPPEFSGSINTTENSLNNLISNIDSTLSVLYSYR